MEAIKAKFQGGPLNNQRKVVESSYGDRMQVAKAPARPWFDAKADPYETMIIVRGDYVRSNKKLKDGTVVYIWMGWQDGSRR